jgi:hypothetical protein
VILATNKLRQTQEAYHDAAITLQQTIATNQQQTDRFANELAQIRQILREGFRLPADRNDEQL